MNTLLPLVVVGLEKDLLETAGRLILLAIFLAGALVAIEILWPDNKKGRR